MRRVNMYVDQPSCIELHVREQVRLDRLQPTATSCSYAPDGSAIRISTALWPSTSLPHALAPGPVGANGSPRSVCNKREAREGQAGALEPQPNLAATIRFESIDLRCVIGSDHSMPVQPKLPAISQSVGHFYVHDTCPLPMPAPPCR